MTVRARHRGYAGASSAAAAHLALGVREAIREHIAMYADRDVGGVLVGYTAGARVTVNAVIPGFRAPSAGEGIAVTPEAWQAVARELQRYPQQQVVGWYHSHRGDAPLLSGGTYGIHHRYFASPEQIALVVDRDGREIWFGWDEGSVRRLAAFDDVDARGSGRRAHKPAAGIPLHAQRGACALLGIVIGTAGWLTLVRAPRPVPHTTRDAHVLRSGTPVAHPIVEEPEAGVQAASTNAGR